MWELLLDLLSWSALLLGAFVIFASAVGVLRLPDYYSRAHAAAVTDTLGAGLFLFGLVLQAGVSLAAGKLGMILFFLVLTGPTATHALARTARAHGLELPSERGGAKPPWEKRSREDRPEEEST